MIPKYGSGPPLPEAPVLMPGDHAGAARYLILIEHALTQEGWSSPQRYRLRAMRAKWILRAEGRDGQYEEHGNFPRCPGAEKPTTTDLVVARWRRKFQDSPEGRKIAAERKRRSQLPKAKRLQQRRWVDRDRHSPTSDRDRSWKED